MRFHTRTASATFGALLLLGTLLGTALTSAEPAPPSGAAPGEAAPPSEAPARRRVDDKAAQALLDEGIKLYQAARYPEAHLKLEPAFEALRSPVSGLWSARALDKLGKLVEASERYAAVAKLPARKDEAAAERAARTEADQERGKVAARIPLVHLQVQGASRDEVSATLDGEPVARVFIADEKVFAGKKSGWFSGWKSLPVNPGSHTLIAQWGKESTTESLALKEGQKLELVVRFGEARIAEEERQKRAQRLAACQGDCRKDCKEDMACFRRCKRSCIARHSPSTGAKTVDDDD